MQKIHKILSIFLVLALGLVLFANNASAQEQLAFTNIKIDGVEFLTVRTTDSNQYPNGSSFEVLNFKDTLQVDRGKTVDIRVELLGLDGFTTENVRVKAWIEGYKYNEIREATSTFDVLEGVTYVKTLSLEIPEDLCATDDYVLHIEASGSNDDSIEEHRFSLMVTPIEDYLAIQDVIINPSLTVQAGKPLYVTVRAENLGANKQEDIRVKVSIPDLGISTRSYMDGLCSNECCGDNCEVDSCCDEDDETSDSSEELMLRIPENAKEGTYELDVELEYDRFHKTTKKTYMVFVESDNEGSTTDGSTSTDNTQRIISVDTATQEVQQGKGIIYRLTLANLGDKTETYNVEVSNVETWGTARVDPSYVVVQKDSTGEAFVYIAANENAVEGLHMFTAKIKSGDNVVKEISLGADVKAKATTLSLTQVLWIVFGVLVLVVLILGIILLIRNSGDNSADMEEPINEGKTYY